MNRSYTLSTTIVIFGASGDLTKRKLIPALYRMHCKDRLPPETRVIGVFLRGVDVDLLQLLSFVE